MTSKPKNRRMPSVPLLVRKSESDLDYTVWVNEPGPPFVAVPRAVNGPAIWSRSWVELVAAATVGGDGLSLRHTMPAPGKELNLAFYREGRGTGTGRPMLLLQNW